MAGLDPAIHDFLARRTKDVDARHKAGHDETKMHECVFFSTSRYCVAGESCFRNSEHVF